MAAEVRVTVPLSLPRVPWRARFYGLGSVFGKSLRDARWGTLVVAGLLGLLIVAGGGTMMSSYATPETRRELALMSSSMPSVLKGFYGDPVNVDTLGGFVSWHYGAYFAMLAGLWSILVLSGTLAGEARRGSLEFTVASPCSRRSLALQKVGGHVVAMVITMVLLAITAWA